MEFRIQATGELKTQGEVRRMHSNTSLPKVWDSATCEALGINPVLAAPKPEVTGYTQANRNGAVQDSLGNWVEAWVVVDAFSDTTEDGVSTTKAEHETAHQARLDATAASSVRTERDALLAKTDWVVIRAKELGQTVPVAIFAYRGDLRQVPEQAGFPHTIIWPTEIEG